MAGPSQRYQPSVAKPLRQLGVQTYGQKWYNINDRKPLGPRIPLLSAQGWVWTRSKDLQARSLQDCAYLSKPRNLRPNSGSGYAQAHAPRETLRGWQKRCCECKFPDTNKGSKVYKTTYMVESHYLCVCVCVFTHTHTNMKMTQVFYSKSLDPVSVVRIREANEVFSLSVFSTFSLLHVHCRRRE